MEKRIVQLLVIFTAYMLVVMVMGCSSDTEYQRNLHTVGVGFEEIAQSGTDVFVYADTVEPVLLKYIALRYRSKYPEQVTVYFFNERIPESDCKVPVPETVKSHFTAQYIFNKKDKVDNLKIVQGAH